MSKYFHTSLRGSCHQVVVLSPDLGIGRLVESKKKRKRLTESEIEARTREDELFAELAKPPQLLGDLSKLAGMGEVPDEAAGKATAGAAGKVVGEPSAVVADEVTSSSTLI